MNGTCNNDINECIFDKGGPRGLLYDPIYGVTRIGLHNGAVFIEGLIVDNDIDNCFAKFRRLKMIATARFKNCTSIVDLALGNVDY